MRQALSEARDTISRITRDSESMTTKSNAWMQAKAEDISSLQEKYREANRVASALRSEKRCLVEATDLLQSTNSQLKANLEANKFEIERYNQLQVKCTQQEGFIDQLENRLAKHGMSKSDQDREIAKQMGVIRDLHNRLQSHMDTMQDLNRQLSTLNQENYRLKSTLEKESLLKRSLEEELDKLKEYAEMCSGSPSPNRIRPKTRAEKPSSEAEKVDKDEFWMGRVSELQADSAHWAERVRDLTCELNELKRNRNRSLIK